MKTVYIIEGSCGQYDNHEEWPVASYLSEDLALKHIELATQETRRLMKKYDNDYLKYLLGTDYSRHSGPLPVDINIYDSHMRWDYPDEEVNYNYYKIEVRESLPTKES
jgi:hypothetical protein